MTYNQKKAGTSLTFEFQEEGLNFTMKDQTIHKSEFIAYEDITNKSHEYFEKNAGHKSRAIYFLVVGILFIIANVIFKMKLWAWMFLLGAPIFYFLYKKSVVNYKVLNTDSGTMDIWVLDDANQDEIIEAIYNKRDAYLKENYLEINYNNESSDEINKFVWLKSMKIISEREFEVIKEEILENENNKKLY